MKRDREIEIIVVFLLLLCGCSTTSHLPEGEVLYTGVRSIDFQWADSIPDTTRTTVEAELRAALACPPNNAIFGSSKARWPLPTGLWIYNRYQGSTSRFGRWMFQTFGSQPVTLTTVNPDLRTRVAEQTLRAYGFFCGQARSTIVPNPHNDRKARVAYSVSSGPLHRLDSIEYLDFGATADSLIAATSQHSLLHRGQPFSAATLDAERQRLSALFRNRGFFYFKPEYITYRADSLQREQAIQLRVQPLPDMPAQARNSYTIGQTRITIFPQGDFNITDSTNNPTRTYTARRRTRMTLTAADSLRLRAARDNFVMRWGGGEQMPLKMSAIRQYLLYQPGQPYHQRLHEMVQSLLAGMGVFSSMQMSYTPRDTTDTCSILDVNIFGILDKPYDSELEARVTNKSNGLLGPGLAWGMSKRNAFRGAENLSFKVRGSYEWQTGVKGEDVDRSLLNSFEFGASLALTYPRLRPRFLQMADFRRQRKLAQRNTTGFNFRTFATTTFKLDAEWMNRASYFRMISVGGRVAYTYRRKPWLQHELTPFRLDYNILSHRSERFDSIMANNQALYVSMRDQFVPSMGYTFTYSPRARAGHSRAVILSAKEAGNILNTIYAAAGQGSTTRNKKLLGTPFAQFFKLTAEWRETWPLFGQSTLAARAQAGAVWSYGNSTMAPYADLLNVGGANSIRAFGVRTIGPGSYHPAASGWSYVDQVGDIKLEANIEWRFPLVGDLAGAIFLDAGNVWLMHPDDNRPGGCIDASTFLREIALGTGAGLRYDLSFLVLRFDVGVGIHAPYQTTRSGYYNMPRFRDSLGFHLAVGYPF